MASRRWDQAPGEAAGLARLDSFLAHRGAAYHKEMSSPASAAEACSRLSASLAWGNVSMRRIVARTREAQRALKANNGHTADGLATRGALVSFGARLHWHCHFMQKLEGEPALEFHCFNRAIDEVRPRPTGGHLEAWCTDARPATWMRACANCRPPAGSTSACARCVDAAYHLWLDWRDFRDFLGRQFIDYEPGIHVSQIQMQSGVTGINTLRIYNPVKQGHDQDPRETTTHAGCRSLQALRGPPSANRGPLDRSNSLQRGSNSIAPSRCGSSTTSRQRVARTRLGSALATPEARQESARVMREHGSRKSGATADEAHGSSAPSVLHPDA